MIEEVDGAITVHGALQAAIDREAAIAQRRADVLRMRQVEEETWEDVRRTLEAFFAQMQEWLRAIAPSIAAAVRAFAPLIHDTQRARIRAARYRARIVTRARGVKRHAPR